MRMAHEWERGGEKNEWWCELELEKGDQSDFCVSIVLGIFYRCVI